MKTSCGECKFYLAIDGYSGNCCRFPPVPLVSFYESTNRTIAAGLGLKAQISSFFPVTYKDQTCWRITYLPEEWMV